MKYSKLKNSNLYYNDSSSGPSFDADGLNDEAALDKSIPNPVDTNSPRDRSEMDESAVASASIPKLIDHNTEMTPSAFKMESAMRKQMT